MVSGVMASISLSVYRHKVFIIVISGLKKLIKSAMRIGLPIVIFLITILLLRVFQSDSHFFLI